jgi:hypothetical protein
MGSDLSKDLTGKSLTKLDGAHQQDKALLSLTFRCPLGIVCRRWKTFSRADLSSDCGRL